MISDVISLAIDGMEYVGKLIIAAFSVAVIGFGAGYGTVLGILIAVGK